MYKRISRSRKKENNKLKYKNDKLEEDLVKLLNTENAIHYLYLKDMAIQYLDELKQNNNKIYTDLLKEEGFKTDKDLNAEEEEILENKFIDYMKFVRDKDHLDRINLLLGEKNLILI